MNEAGQSEGEGLERINARLHEIAALLSDPETADRDAVGLAREAAALVGEALEQTERAVAGLEQED